MIGGIGVAQSDFVHENFVLLPDNVQSEGLALIQKVNELHLHCEVPEDWQKAHYIMTALFSNNYVQKLRKHQTPDVPAALAADPQQQDPNLAMVMGHRKYSAMLPISHKYYQKCLERVRKSLDEVFHDPMFVEPVLNAFQHHILTALKDHSELAGLMSSWIGINAMYIPLGTHLINAYKKDMEGESKFSKHVMQHEKIDILNDARSKEAIKHMTAFLAEAAQAHSHSYVEPPKRSEQPTAIMLSVKNGAGGHTAPTQAMAARLNERGWRVETVYYDTDLSPESDHFSMLGITFEDGTPMTRHLYNTRWTMQKTNKKVAKIVRYYVAARQILTPDIFIDDSGGELLRKRILPLNPQLLVTTLAYHWIWRSLAYRVAGAKTLLVASDVFFHQQAYYPWYRQQDIPEDLRKMHFTTMTDDMELLLSEADHHDGYWRKKYPGRKIDSWKPLFEGLQLDSQISVIGAPIHPSFDAITDPNEIIRLRKKWNVPDGAISICISRGKLGFASDLLPALESYRTHEKLPKPVVLQVVCGENTLFYERLVAGEFKDLGPNITIQPHPLRAPKDFAELRAISTIDDIKAGGGSTFEGWYLISKGAKSMLLLTPGPDLWWEGSNCDAMEKWGVGRTIQDGMSKIEILKEVIVKGLKPITYRFPDWKKPFDKVVECYK